MYVIFMPMVADLAKNPPYPGWNTTANGCKSYGTNAVGVKINKMAVF